MLSGAVRKGVSGLTTRGSIARACSRTLAYKAPTRDMAFVMKELLNCEEHYKRIGYDNADWETIDMLVSECAKFSENVLEPLNVIGDTQGAKLIKGEGKKLDANGRKLDGNRVVTTPGFKEAYDEWSAAGWSSLSVPEAYGGQGLPVSVGILRSEMVGTAAWALGMYSGLSMGCMNTLILHGSEEMKQTYLPKLADGSWLGTMCLTEPQCGTDLAQVATAAVRQDDGTYRLTGTKIWISSGDHDLGENIIHIVLARVPGSPPGTKGISLFLVPKHIINEDGSLEESINVECARLENKMGINASATAEMSFENSVGYLIGKENDGLRQMFAFMNTARLGTGLQGIGAAEAAYQVAVPFAKERLAMRAMSGTKYPEKPADPIIVHGDVRRMLLTMRAVSEGGRAILYDAALLGDYWLAEKVDEAKRNEVEDYMGVLTPIVKGFLTELGLESASHAIQVWGGQGYMKENFPEQNYRDARISTIYEGTTGVQAIDLLGRKVLLNRMKHLDTLHKEIRSHCFKHIFSSSPVGAYARQIAMLTVQWKLNTVKIGAMAMKDRDAVGAASFDYLMYSGYITMGYYWMRMAAVAEARLAEGNLGADEQFYRTKLSTAEFYFAKMLPRTESHAKSMLSGSKGTMTFKEEDF